MGKERIFLIGFMGAGKSTVGPLLATKLNWAFLDLDREIEVVAGESITEIFATKGEPYFRDLETRVLRSLKDRSCYVIALGGGTFVQELNRHLISELGYTVFLDCPLELLLERCPPDGTRPLLQNRAQIEMLYKKRLPVYQNSDLRVDVSHWEPEKIANFIFQQTMSVVEMKIQ